MTDGSEGAARAVRLGLRGRLAVVAVLVAVVAGLVGVLVARSGGNADAIGRESATASTTVAASDPAAATTTTAPNGAGGHGHGDPNATPTSEPTAGERRAMDAELERVVELGRPYETVADALADGFVGTPDDVNDSHYVRWDRMDGTFDLDAPEMVLAAGPDPDDPIIALVYYVVGDLTTAPEGFTGPSDLWHTHQGFCRIEDRVGDPSTCASLGAPTLDGWMLHVWTMAGSPNPKGPFVTENPDRPTG